MSQEEARESGLPWVGTCLSTRLLLPQSFDSGPELLQHHLHLRAVITEIVHACEEVACQFLCILSSVLLCRWGCLPIFLGARFQSARALNWQLSQLWVEIISGC